MTSARSELAISGSLLRIFFGLQIFPRLVASSDIAYFLLSLDELLAAQYQWDFRTGTQSAITGPRFCSRQRVACSSLNATRAPGLIAACPHLSTDRHPRDDKRIFILELATENHFPIIPLSQLGFTRNEDFLECSPEQGLRHIHSGKEADIFADQKQAVYKLFGRRRDGSLGTTLVLNRTADDRIELTQRPATLSETVAKLVLLNDIGAHPTEVVGLSDDGQFLVAKQPFATPCQRYSTDHETACRNIRSWMPFAVQLRTQGRAVWLDDKLWIIDDLHRQNIMRDGDGQPTIIDALATQIDLTSFPGLASLALQARALRLNLPRPEFPEPDDSEL